MGAAATGGGLSFAGALTILFIALKLTGVITWSWVWVLAPLWVGAIAAVIGFLFVLVIFGLFVAVSKRFL